MSYRTLPVSSADKPDLQELEDLIDLTLSAVNERLLDTKCVPSDGNHWPGYLLKKRNNLLSLLVLADPDLASPWEWGLRDLRYIIGTMDGSSGYTQPKNFLNSGIPLPASGGWYWWDGSYMEYPCNTALVKGYQAVNSANIWTLAGLANYSYPATPPFVHKLVPNEFATLLSQLKVLASPTGSGWVADASTRLTGSGSTRAAAFAALGSGGTGADPIGWYGSGAQPPWNLQCTQKCDATINTNTGDAGWTAASLSGCKLFVGTPNPWSSNGGPAVPLDVYVGGAKVGSVTANNVLIYNFGGWYAWLDVAPSLINFSGDTTISLKIPNPKTDPGGGWEGIYLYNWFSLAGQSHLPSVQLFYERDYKFTI
jgi:hypothetical protein